MYVKFNDISDDVKEKVRSDYKGNEVSIRTIKKRYGLFRNEILAIVGQTDVRDDDYADGVIGASSFVAISDLHIGSIYEKPWYYEYLAEYLEIHDIRDVVIAGDFLQGNMPPLQEQYSNPIMQVKHAVNLIPVLDKVTWHILFGNHDLSLLRLSDKYYAVLRSRKDFHFLGFKRAYMKFGAHLFSLSHHTSKYRIDSPSINADFRFRGHGHYVGVKDESINLPTFSLDTKNGTTGSPYPGFVVARRLKNELGFFYYMFDEKVTKNTDNTELKKIRGRKLEPVEMGKILTIPR